MTEEQFRDMMADIITKEQKKLGKSYVLLLTVTNETNRILAFGDK